jgi:hypothetical protein
MKTTRLARLPRRAFWLRLLTCLLMLLAPVGMLLAVRSANMHGIWVGLGAFILANLLELGFHE